MMKFVASIVVALAAVVSIASLLSAAAQDPGIRIRVTNKGFQFANDVGVAVLQDRLRKDKLENVYGRNGKLTYSVTNIENRGVYIGSSSLKTVGGVGVVLQGSSIDLNFAGNWAYRRKLLWSSLRDSGRFTLSARGVAFSVKQRFGVDSSGRPTISTRAEDCTAEVDDVDVHFRGGASWIYNLFSRFIEKALERQLEKLICQEGQRLINVEAAKSLATFPVERRISENVSIDYSLVQRPVATTQYLDLLLKGECQSANSPQPVPFSPAPLPPLYEVDKMMYIWFTDYVFNTASLAYHNSGALRTTIKPFKKPVDSHFQLNTRSFKGFLPQLFLLYPDRPVFVKIYTTAAPVFASSSTGISVTVPGNIEVYVTAKNNASIYGLSVGLIVKLQGSLSLKNGNLALHANSFSVEIRDVRSAVGEMMLNKFLFQAFINGFVRSEGFMKKINSYGAKGLPLPMLRKLALTNTDVTSGNGFTLIKTNLKSLPNLY